jgi:hypothetical protein
MKQNPLWLFLNVYGWLIFIMSVITAFVVGAWWVVLFGVIGYQVVLVVELMWGGALARTGRIRLARAEQENRELRDEKARLVGTIEELMGQAGSAEETVAERPVEEPDPPSKPGESGS